MPKTPITNNPFFLALSRKSLPTQKSYSNRVQLYLKWLQDKSKLSQVFDYDNVIDYLNHLEKKNKSQSTSNISYNAIKFYFKAYNKPFKDTDAPKISVYRQKHPVFNVEEMKQLILAVKTIGTDTQKAYLSISTTFGLRPGEMTLIEDKDIVKDKYKNLIFVKTLKNGFQRWHLIPKEIESYVLNFNFLPIKSFAFSLMFKEICYLAKLNLLETEWTGWHTIRRSLVTELDTLYSQDDDLLKFFRWKTANISMLKRYSRLDGNDEKLFEIDKRIFAVHPYLKWWT